MSRRSSRRKQSNGLKIAILLLVTAAIGVGAVFGTSKAIKQVNASNNMTSWETVASNETDANEQQLDEVTAAYVVKIKETYSRSATLENIIENIQEYPQSLLDTLLLRPELIDFISGYTTHQQYGFDNCKNIDVSADYTPGEIPLFLQWDERWGYETYGSDLVALNACGPTCFAMVYVGLTGDTSVNPLTISKMCIENDYYYYGSGTGTELFDYGVSKYGLASKRISLTKTAVLSSLNAGHPIVVNVTKGDFTTIGHYIVLTGVAADGKVTVNDPNSIINSGKTWDIDRIIGQSRTMWSIWKD